MGCTKTANKDLASKKMHSFDLLMQQVDDSMAVNPNYALRLINNNIPNVKDNVVYCKFISMRAWNYVRKSQNDSANKCFGIILNYAWKMKVIFYTAHDDYMLQAIRNSAFDYLMKPFDSNELNLMLNRFREDFVKSKMGIPILLPDVSNSFLIATPLGYRKVHFNEIGYFEYNKDKRSWQAMLVDKSSLTLKVNTKAESILNVSETFFKISKQHIINWSYLSIIDDGRCFLLDPFNDTRLSISRDSLKNLHK